MVRLRTRILAAYLAALLPVAAGFGWWASVRAEREFDAELGTRLSEQAGLLAAQFTATTAAGRIARLEPDSEASIERLREGLEVAREAVGLRRVRLVDPSLRTLVDTVPETPAFVEAFDIAGDTVEVNTAIAERTSVSSVRFYAEDGTPYKRGYAPVVHDDEVVALVVVEGPAAYFARLHGIRRAIIGAGALALLLTIGATVFVSRRITAPLSRLAGAARRIGSGDLQTPIEVQESDEIGQLATALQRMQRNLASREEEQQMMLAGIAHEVRNPLGGMELFVGLLEETLEPGSEEAGYAARVRRELLYLARVVEEFLEFARERSIETSRGPLAPFLDAVHQNVASLADEAGVALTVEAPTDGLEISGDLDALRGVVQNVVSNAVQACAARESVIVRARADGADRVIEVVDTGAGMPPEVLEQVFRPFYTTREKGTGLGLPLAKKTVERHGGTLAIRSEPGLGTTVELRVPFDPAAPVRDASARAGGLRCDDDDEMIG